MVSLRDTKKARTRTRLAKTAISLFDKRGLENVTISDIATAADVGKGTLYNYYGSKEDILIEFLHGVERATLANIASARIARRGLASILHDAAWRLLACKEAHYAYARAVMARLVGGDSAFLARVDFFQEAVRGAFTHLFARMIEDGRVATRWRAEELGLQFTVLHLGLSSLWAMEGPPFAGAAHACRTQAEIFARGIAAKGIEA